MAKLIQISGELFTAVQLSNIFPDCKTFVDAIPLRATEVILAEYQVLKDKRGFDLKQFIRDNFSLREEQSPTEQSPTTQSLTEQSSTEQSSTELSTVEATHGLHALNTHIANLWQQLKREPDQIISGDSLIALPYPYIVPGGRFSEIYYWDSYFTAEGLAAAGGKGGEGGDGMALRHGKRGGGIILRRC